MFKITMWLESTGETYGEKWLCAVCFLAHSGDNLPNSILINNVYKIFYFIYFNDFKCTYNINKHIKTVFTHSHNIMHKNLKPVFITIYEMWKLEFYFYYFLGFYFLKK